MSFTANLKKRQPVMTESNKLLNLLGLARRAGVLTVGQDKVSESCKSCKLLVIVTSDVSENVLRMLKTAVENNSATIYKAEFDRNCLGSAIGVHTAQIVAIEKDSNFAKKLLNEIKGSDANE